MSFATDLKTAMDGEKITVKDLAEYTGCHESSVWNWLNGTSFPRRKNMIEICDLLGLSKEKYEKERESKQRAWSTTSSPVEWDGEKLKALMKDRNLSNSELARRIGVHSTTLGGWKNGASPSLDSLDKLNKYFHVKDEFWNPNVVGEFNPKPYCDPKVKEKVDLAEKPYSFPTVKIPKQPMPVTIPPEMLAVGETVDVRDEIIKQLQADYEALSQRLETAIGKWHDAEKAITKLTKEVALYQERMVSYTDNLTEYELKVDNLEDKLIYLRGMLDGRMELSNGVGEVIEKKSWWQRLWE